MRILLVDDHSLFLEGLTNLLQIGGHEVVGAAYDGLEALQLARTLRPDVILMDVRMPDCDGIEATRIIHAEFPMIKIVMLTTSAEDADLIEAIQNGASGYLLKNLKPNVLFNYLAGLARGEAPLSRELSSKLLNAYMQQAKIVDEQKQSQHESLAISEAYCAQQPSPQRVEEFTIRQQEILEFVVKGFTYKEIGAALQVSENTVKYHMREIIQRLKVKNREQVVTYVLQHKLISLRNKLD